MLAPAADPLLDWLDARAQKLLDERDAVLEKITTRKQALERQEFVRKTLLRLLGGLPATDAPLNARVTGTLIRPGFRIEKLHFDAFSRYPVTANLYLPDKPGRHPAILFSMGHWEVGKSVAYLTAANLALKGFVVLAYDPVGQGERLQSFEPRIGRSLAGGATDQHFMDGARAILNGTALTRWFVHDSRRAIDYLVTRPEVDAERIGATGCSGGGTQTAFLSALEPRIKAAAPACYITSFRELFTGSIGDSEQSPHGFISAGLDQPDLVMAFAPKPYLIVSTEKDFFPIAGARRAYQQARRFYALFDAESRIRHAVGPGGHGTPIEVRREIYRFFLENLGDASQSSEEVEVEPLSEFALWTTRGGQVSRDLGARELVDVMAEEHLVNVRTETPEKIRGLIKDWMREPEPSLHPAFEKLDPPAGVTKKDIAFLIVQPWKWTEPLALELQKLGYPVLLVRPRGAPVDDRGAAFNQGWQDSTRASLVGLSLPALRARDIVSGVDELRRTGGARQVYAYGRRSAGAWLLMAAAVDERIDRVWIHQAPASWREAIASPLHRALFEIAIPGAALQFDIPDLVQSIRPRLVFFTDPLDPVRNPSPRDGDFIFRPWDSPDIEYLPRFLGTP